MGAGSRKAQSGSSLEEMSVGETQDRPEPLRPKPLCPELCVLSLCVVTSDCRPRQIGQYVLPEPCKAPLNLEVLVSRRGRGRPRAEVPRSAASGCGGMQPPGPEHRWCGGIEHSRSPHPQHSTWCRAVPSQPSLHEHSVPGCTRTTAPGRDLGICTHHHFPVFALLGK